MNPSEGRSPILPDTEDDNVGEVECFVPKSTTGRSAERLSASIAHILSLTPGCVPSEERTRTRTRRQNVQSYSSVPHKEHSNSESCPVGSSSSVCCPPWEELEQRLHSLYTPQKHSHVGEGRCGLESPCKPWDRVTLWLQDEMPVHTMSSKMVKIQLRT